MKTYSLTEISKYFNVNRSTAYRWTQQFKHQLASTVHRTRKGITISEEGRSILAALVADRVTACTNTATVCNASQSPASTARQSAMPIPETLYIYKEQITQQSAMLAQRDATIEQLQRDIRELNNTQREERQRSDTIVFNLSKQIQSQGLLLEDLRKTLQPVQISDPSPTPVSWMRRAWSWFQGAAFDIEIGGKKEGQQQGLRPITESKAA